MSKVIVNEGSDFVIVHQSRVFGSDPVEAFKVSGEDGSVSVAGEAIGGEIVDATARADIAAITSEDPVTAALGDASVSIAVGTASKFTIAAALLTANRTLTLSTTGAAIGDTIWIVRHDTTAHTIAVVNGGSGAGTLYTFPVSVARIADFVFDGTDWLLGGSHRLVA
jgi:hypothetical protein